ncbi:hypothetical protein ACFVGY_16090 [Streptomyces sp. NPDC127106]|uniref:hypothetical protein n=1 Tax=Streptomyces sp. NPDC127106 TaxID=3345360 RepID=UPI0036380AFC
MGMDVDAVVAELYGLRPGEFIAARDAYAARARREKDTAAARRIAALRKPTLAVWTVNVLARARPEEAEALLDLGGELRRAHRELDGAQLRTLSRRQHQVIAGLARDAATLAAAAGERVSDSVQREVEQILHGLLADPDAGSDWIAGHLNAAPEPAGGFAGLEPAPGARLAQEAPAPAARPRTEEPPGPGQQTPDDGRAPARQARRRAAEREAEVARTAEAQAATELAEAEAELGAARANAADLRARLADLRERSTAADEEAAAAAGRHQEAEKAARRARKDVEAALRRLADSA